MSEGAAFDVAGAPFAVTGAPIRTEAVAVDGRPVLVDRAGAGGPWLLLIHGLASDRRQWRPQLEAFGRTRRVVAYDLRGHGGTSADRAGSVAAGDALIAGGATVSANAVDAPIPVWRIADLADDALALLDALDIERADVVGLSLGGLVAMGLADRAPGRVASLTLADTTARYPEAARAAWDARIGIAATDGMSALVAPSLQRWFAPGFARTAPDTVAAAAETIAGTSVAGYCGCAAALRDTDLTSALARWRGPTQVIVGACDEATPPAFAEALAAAVPGSRLDVIAGAAHLSNVERPDAFNAVLGRFLEDGASVKPSA